MDTDDSDLELFYVIVVGTGLVESILARALARGLKKVLHWVRNNFYGSDWTTMTPLDFSSWSTSNTDNDDTNDDTAASGNHAPFRCTSAWKIEDEDRWRRSRSPTKKKKNHR
jgi:RAB protein geranylgeranyltransferase component A